MDEDQFAVEQILDTLLKLVTDARSSIRSSTVVMNRDELLVLLKEAREKFPEEVKAARWLVKERKLFIEKVQQEKVEIVEEAQKRSAELVSRVEVVREAQRQAHHILHEAREEATRTKNQLEIYCENQLAKFEQALEDVFKVVQQGRAKLQAVVSEESVEPLDQQNELDFSQPPTPVNPYQDPLIN